MQQIEEVYRLYFDDVYRYVYSLCRNQELAEEITQETFFKALKKIDDFRGDSKLRVWLCQIAKNTYFTKLKKEKRRNELLIQDDVTTPAIDDYLVNKEDTITIHKMVHLLKEPYKEVFHLRVFGELSFREIGEVFGKTEAWARVVFHRAKIKVQEKINESDL